jgi:UDP-N-acetylmuramoyl-tripeptide--D-alanyl-D-alanine ligase
LSFLDLKPKRVVCDSRVVKEGDLFVAIKGENVDGHDFVEEAFLKGASYAIVERPLSLPFPLYVVKSSIKALQALAKAKLEEKRPKIIGITGSFGKTTTKEFLAHLLSKKYRVAKSFGNYNSKIGLPLTILNDFKDEEILILEMGMTEGGHIDELVQIAPPDIALITSVSLVHACNFDSIEGIAKAKSEIFSHPKTKERVCHESTLSFEEIRKWNPSSYGGSLPSSLPFHLQQNALAAKKIATLLEVDPDLIEEGLSQLTVLEGRGNLVEKSSVFFYNDTYNASEVSMLAALNELEKKSGRKVAVLGEMLELGKFSLSAHENVLKKALSVADCVMCLGKEWTPFSSILKERLFLTLEELTLFLKKELRPKDHVLLKGSNGNKLWRILDGPWVI